jgi:hypothetical protein
VNAAGRNPAKPVPAVVAAFAFAFAVGRATG